MNNEEYLALVRSLTNQPPTPEQVERMEKLREVAHAYAWAVIELCPDGREKSVAKTKLEESVMWAIKGIALEVQPPAPTFAS